MVSLPSQKMAYWNIELDGSDFNEVRRFVQGIDVEYELNSIAKASISISSISFLESFFQRGKKVKIKFGWDRLSMVTMIDGVIDKNPTGNASDFQSYTVTVLDSAASMSYKDRNVVWNPPIKQQIIRTIASKNGYASVVNIKDNSPLLAKEIPIQRNKTDLEFLYECADKWNCLFWINSFTRTIYFMDASEVHRQGDQIHASNPVRSLDDVTGPYQLGYKTDYGTNNVANLSWQFGTPPNGNIGSQIARGSSESNRRVAPEDYIYEFYGNQYKFSPEVIAQIKRDPSFAVRILQNTVTSPVNGSEISQYWKPVDVNSRTNRNLQSSPVHKLNQLTVSCDLNKGDIYLRPPRKATLLCGSQNPRAVTSDLPGYLVNSGSEGRTFNINKVKTSLSDGMIKTNMEMTV